ncbi:MAG: lytic murein transglycosylase [Xanthobacteraceae bacterium]
MAIDAGGSICPAQPPAAPSVAAADFQNFVEGLWPDAQAAGITRQTFDAAFAGVSVDPRVIALVQKQPEYGKPIKAYVEEIASPARIEAGRRKAAEWAKTFAAVEQKYAVGRAAILGIWGIETSFGSEKDKWDVIRSLATLAQASDRAPYFRTELINALKMLQQDAVDRKRMLGSWAGAMGQPQFMPSDYLDYAVSFSGGGRSDIWTSVPDVLASIANYLHRDGWDANLPWGFEVVVPAGFDYLRSRGSFAAWKQLGVKRADGAEMPSAGDAIMFFPAGASGPAFLVTANFNVIKLYNNSDVYALAVSYLGDRIRGGGPIRAAWPKDDIQLSRDQRIALQRKLAALGYTVNDFAAHIDFDLRDAIRDVQKKLGMVPDGNPTPELLRRLDELKP